MIELSSVIIFLLVFSVLAYHRASLIIFTLSLFLLSIFLTTLLGFNTLIILTWLIFVVVLIPLNIIPLRRQLFSRPLLKFYRSIMPSMSKTEREAIAAGTVTWEGDLFRGNPNWDKLLSYPKSKLTEEEEAFINGPVETLCRMIDDWKITQHQLDLSQATWKFIKENGFFGLIIPKQYGGKEFSAFAHSQILVKISSRSITASSTVAVPNSLGPAELLLHYGTDEQKNYYLPRLARGEEVPCFALTSQEAGSDAGSMTDHGVIEWGEYEGQKVLGIKLNFDKRYITLAPIATVIGLAFKLYDPKHLIGEKEELGITCALIPAHTKGIKIGRRHFALNTPFQNGPIHGENVFVPLNWIIGGIKNAGKGWRMLMECLAAGRAISLPASALGGAKVSTFATGAYTRIRKQFNMSIGNFEGIEEPLARIAGFTYIMDSARTFAASLIDLAEKPAIVSAIVKYHVTELGRKIAVDSMDIHGGKGICLGPKNYLARGYESSPIAITVEGANILTRNMIIFGQGAIRCHPYVLAELNAAKIADEKESLKTFDQNVFKHMGFGISNIIRSFFLSLSSGLMVKAPSTKTKRYFQQATRFSSAFALIADVSMLSLGGNLKRKESLSASLGDVLSLLFLVSSVLKHYHDEGEQKEDFPLVRYSCEYCFYEIQEKLSELIKNFPNRLLAFFLNLLIFPLGKHFEKPKNRLQHKIAQLLMSPTDTRMRLSKGAFLSLVKENVLSDIEDALYKTIAAEPIDKIIKAAKHDGLISGYTINELAENASQKQIITSEQLDIFMQAQIARLKVIAVDDFSNQELTRNESTIE